MEITTTFPWASARHWVSTCLGLSRYFSTKHSPLPKAAIASLVAESKASSISDSSRTILIPRPPPPKAALIATGNPCLATKSFTSLAPVTGFMVPGARGAPTLWATVRAETLSPSFRIESGDGPIQISPASITAWAKSAFSDKNP